MPPEEPPLYRTLQRGPFLPVLLLALAVAGWSGFQTARAGQHARNHRRAGEERSGFQETA
jgi:hypothetical protein